MIPPANDLLLVYCTCPDADSAARVAASLVEQRLAACVNIVSGVRSVYRWRGAVEQADEHLLVIKSRASRYSALEAAVQALHPYELPEIIAVPISAGLPAYLAWVADSVEDVV